MSVRGGRGRGPGALVVALAALALLVPAPAGATDGTSAVTPTVERVAGTDRVATAVALSRRTSDRADTAVVARADDVADALAGAVLARHLGGPLLLSGPDALPAAVTEELQRLGVREVVLLGGERALGPGVATDAAGDGRSVRRVAGATRYATAAAVADALPLTNTVYVASGTRFADALAVAPLAATTGRPILLVTTDAVPPATRAALERMDPAHVVIVGGRMAVGEQVADALAAPGRGVERLAGASRYETGAAVFRAEVAAGLDPSTVWLAAGTAFADAVAAGPAAAAAGHPLLLVPGHDLRVAPAPISALRDLGDVLGHVVVLGGPAAITADAPWELAGILDGPQLPRGGRVFFPARRLVGFYGNAEAPVLGVLGEQGPDAAYERLWNQAAPYAAGGRPLLPVFELIVSVATRSPGPDGDYSRPTDEATIQPWLDAARRHEVYLLLDVQPGRSTFPEALQRYLPLLAEPDVGIALDPEWRVGADQTPGGGTIGTVDAAEVNEVVDRVAAVVREHHLPQKLFVVHQFRTDMVTHRDQIRAPAELAVVFQMDGQGSRSQKLDTYRHVHAEVAGPYHSGFKLFYDEDRDMFRPEEVLGLDPVPELITYQ